MRLLQIPLNLRQFALSSLGRAPFAPAVGTLFRPEFSARIDSARSKSTSRRMSHPISVFFLGTSSGGGPSESRNCSSLVVDMGNGDLLMVDCAEGTLRQFSFQPATGEQRYRASRVKKIFITHMHADHIMGITTMLRNVLRPPWFDHALDGEHPPSEPTLELYGPAGLRKFVRNCLLSTATRTADKYVVHELLTVGDEVTSCEPDDLHGSEAPGLDIRADKDGFWRECINVNNPQYGLIVDAGPIIHRDPCIGYVFREPITPFRKLVLLGDTKDPSAIVPLITSLPGPPPDLLVHEATDAYIPPQVDYKANRTAETVLEKCVERAHSTPGMAGEFAKKINAQRLVLNHIGSRFPAPSHTSSKGVHIRSKILQEIANQATTAWGSGRPAIAATDFFRLVIPAPYISRAGVVGAPLDMIDMDLATTVPEGRTGYRGGGRRGGGGDHSLPARPGGPPYPQHQPHGHQGRHDDGHRNDGRRDGRRGRGHEGRNHDGRRDRDEGSV